LTDFDEIWRADASPHSRPQLNFAISKIQDGGGGHLENSKNRNIFAMERAILTKFGTMMRIGPTYTGSK